MVKIRVRIMSVGVLTKIGACVFVYVFVYVCTQLDTSNLEEAFQVFVSRVDVTYTPGTMTHFTTVYPVCNVTHIKGSTLMLAATLHSFLLVESFPRLKRSNCKHPAANISSVSVVCA